MVRFPIPNSNVPLRMLCLPTPIRHGRPRWGVCSHLLSYLLQLLRIGDVEERRQLRNEHGSANAHLGSAEASRLSSLLMFVSVTQVNFMDSGRFPMPWTFFGLCE